MSNINNFSELDKSLSESEIKPEFYKPTSFWREAAVKISDELKISGIHNFRNINSSLEFFVPNFGAPANGFSENEVNSLISFAKDNLKLSEKALMTLGQYLSGFFHARSDYRVLMASDIKTKRPYLHEFNESTFGNPIEQFQFDGRNYSRSSLNYLLGLSMLKQHIDTESIQTVLEIGGGFGTLGEILSQSGLTDIRYIDVDIPPVQYVAAEYLKSTLGDDRVLSNSPTNSEKLNISTLPMVTVLCNWQIEQLLGEIDLFVNFISFQEMEPFVVSNYLRHVDRLKSKWILLRNMREGKQKKTSTSFGVEVPILSEDYLGMLSNYRLIARNVHPFGYETVDNFHSELLLLERFS
jgi:putative sugar O-methyltransferase